MSGYRLAVTTTGTEDPRVDQLLRASRELGLEPSAVTIVDLYHLDGDLSQEDAALLANKLLIDPVTQTGRWETTDDPPHHDLEIGYRPGVADIAAEELVRAAHRLGIDGLTRAATGHRYDIEALDDDQLRLLAERLLVNEVTQRWTIGHLYPGYVVDADAAPPIETIAIRGLDPTALDALSHERGLSLSTDELVAIAAHYADVGRDPTDAELEMLAQTWSEHCCHKTFRATIQHGEERIDGLLDAFLRAATDQIDAPWVRSAFVDNAGIVAFDDSWDVCVKAETHNHPSAIEPFGGANTGVGGVVRDVIGVSAKPIAITDVLCFGLTDIDRDDLPDGVLHPARIRAGVIEGIGDYGNKIGVPTIAGAILHDPAYTTTPLVFAGCVGLLPRNSHRTEPRPGDHIVVLGGAVGRDGVGGATFSSRSMGSETLEVAGAAVQIGRPITEKGLIDIVVAARDAGLYTAITDCGAGGLSSAIGEMAEGLGADVSLDDVPTKYPGLAAWELWLSEAQERMVLAVPDPEPLEELARIFQVPICVVGTFTDTGRVVVRHGDDTALDIDLEFLHDGRPAVAMVSEPPAVERPERRPTGIDPNDALLVLLTHPSIRSNESVIRTYDHEVLGGTVVRPLTGVEADAPSDGTVLIPPETGGNRAIAIGIGINARRGALDPYRMARSVVDEAIRNAVAAGADPDELSLLDNFAWGDPTNPATLGQLVEACRGCRDAALLHGAPFVSGKDSLYNEFVDPSGEHDPVAPTLMITALGLLDPERAVSTDPVEAGELLYLVGGNRGELGGSHLDAIAAIDNGGEVPAPDPDAHDRYQLVHRAIADGLVVSCHDCAEGGLAVTLAEMAVGADLGLEARLDDASNQSVEALLFAESNGRFVISVDAAHAGAFEAALGGHATLLGRTTAERAVRVDVGDERAIDLTVDQLRHAYVGVQQS